MTGDVHKMTTYIALLRGVNVGRNILKMDRLHAVCAELGMRNAKTYVQSGNVAFEAEGSARWWTEALEQKLAGETRLPVSVIVKTAAEMAAVVAVNPFLQESGIDASRLYVTFLGSAPAKSGLANLEALNAGPDRFRLIGKEIYLHCPGGYGRTNLTNNAFEKALSVRGTTRNWNTVRKLNEMAMGTPASAAAGASRRRRSSH